MGAKQSTEKKDEANAPAATAAAPAAGAQQKDGAAAVPVTNDAAGAPAGAPADAAADAPADAAAADTPKKPATLCLQKKSPNGWWQDRYFTLDMSHGTLTYYEDAEAKVFKGAIPLEMISRVSVITKERAIELDIPGRHFKLRVPCENPKKLMSAEEKKVLEQLKAQFLAAAAATSMLDDKPIREGPGESKYWRKAVWHKKRKQLGALEVGGRRSRLPHPGYPDRAPPSSGDLDWEEALEGYTPPTFDKGPAAGPAASASWVGDGDVKLGNGKPLCPMGRTGLGGLGELPHLGPNQEVRLVVTKEDGASGLLVAIVRRGNTPGGEWMLPGGFLPKPSKATPGAKTMGQVFKIQAVGGGGTKSDEAAMQKMFTDDAADAAPHGVAGEAGAGLMGPLGPLPADQPPWCVYRGFCDHSANTDNAWREACVGHFRCPTGDLPELVAGSGCDSAKWIKVPPLTGGGQASFWADLNPLHRQFVRAALLQHSAM